MTTNTKMTKSQEVATDVAALLRARNPLLWIVTREEARVERYLLEAASAANYVPRTWDVAQGILKSNGQPETASGMSGQEDPDSALRLIGTRALSANPVKERGLWIMRDLHAWVVGPSGATVLRNLRNLARALPGVVRESAQAIVIITPSGEVPPELAGHATVIEWPLPDREEIAAVLDAALNSLPDELKKTAAPNGVRDTAIDSAVGLSGEEAAACYAKSIVQLRKIDPAAVSKEKKRVVARERVLEWYDPIPGGLDAVGGLENLKAWLEARKLAYSPKARAYGLPSPKGTMIVGVPGTGKSLTAKAVSTAWNVPLLKMDLGALRSKYVGDSEANLRKAFRTIEAIGRCVVWLDEIEKGLQGATSGSADGGVSADALGAILQWMQERQGEAFVIATANDATSLPPELLRKGRFDEVWWVDLPTPSEREAILTAALKANSRSAAELKITVSKVASVCDGFTGSEIAALVPEAMYAAFADDSREITTDDLLKAAATVTPLSKTAAEKIEKLRAWAKGRARPATAAESVAEGKASRASRKIDLE